nr:hypothetical protein [Massilistercora timonensis]
MWEKCDREQENPAIIKDEEYKKQTRITIYRSEDIAPFEIVCGIYGLMFHTVFAKDITEALNKYEGMKLDLQKFIDSDLNEKEFCHSFIDKW